MTGYWWSCEKEACRSEFEFEDLRKSSGAGSIAAFIRDVLLRKNWDQALLLQQCPRCGQRSARITYDFPRRKNPLVFRVANIVGLDWGISYLPMMWGSHKVGDPVEVIYDFKYLEGRNPKGLGNPAIFKEGDLAELFALYCEKTGRRSFPIASGS